MVCARSCPRCTTSPVSPPIDARPLDGGCVLYFGSVSDALLLKRSSPSVSPSKHLSDPLPSSPRLWFPLARLATYCTLPRSVSSRLSLSHTFFPSFPAYRNRFALSHVCPFLFVSLSLSLSLQSLFLFFPPPFPALPPDTSRSIPGRRERL